MGNKKNRDNTNSIEKKENKIIAVKDTKIKRFFQKLVKYSALLFKVSLIVIFIMVVISAVGIKFPFWLFYFPIILGVIFLRIYVESGKN
jgi:hypothetical protein